MDNENKNPNIPDAEPVPEQTAERTRENSAAVSESTQKKNTADEFYIDGDAKDENNEPKYTGTTNTFITGMIKAAVYVTCVVLISVFLAVGIIVVGNDVFALVKDDKVVEITVSDSTTVSELADILAEHEIIKYPAGCKIYLQAHIRYRQL